MKTTRLNNGTLVLAKEDGSALKYGNRTAADKERDAVRGEFPHSFTYQAIAPARGFYVGVRASGGMRAPGGMRAEVADDEPVTVQEATPPALLRQGGVELAALKLNKGGEPAHPLYLSYNLDFELPPYVLIRDPASEALALAHVERASSNFGGLPESMTADLRRMVGRGFKGVMRRARKAARAEGEAGLRARLGEVRP